jgi:hypothetical protein
MPLVVAGSAPARLEGRPVYLVGYPVRDARRNEPEAITRIFRDVYNVKRVQPGRLRSSLQFRDIHLVEHDCAPLGHTAGGAIIDLETHQVLGMQLHSRYLDMGTAIPLWEMRDDPLLREAGVIFVEATAQQFKTASQQLERLARSRYWAEVREFLNTVYNRAFSCA